MYSRPPKKSTGSAKLPLLKKNGKKNENHPFRLKSTYAAHDRTQLETVFDYPLLPSMQGAFHSQTYAVDAWLFFPSQMGVTPHTYTKDRFYSDLRPLVRFREPNLSYKDLKGLRGSDNSPILFLRKYIRGVAEGHTPTTFHRAISEARIFGCTFASYFLKRIAKRTKALQRVHQYIATIYDESGNGAESLEHYMEETRELLSKATYLLKDWRELLREAEALNQEYLRPIVMELRFVDEYCTYRFRDGLASLMRVATEIDQRLVPNIDYLSFLRRCMAINRLEHWNARRNGYSWINEHSTDEEVEAYMYRRGILKRRIWSVLYLKIRGRPLFEFQRQLGAMAAAGLAALWWAVAMYFISSRGGALQNNAAANANNNFWESSGFLIVTATMIAYIMKDRIKENGRAFISGRIFRRVPDNSERIIYESGTEAPIEIGSVNEYTRFVMPEELPLDVKDLRQHSYKDELEADDAPKNIIHYRKVIESYPRAISELDFKVNAVHDILRINIAGYLTRLDDPQAGTDIVSTDGTLSSLKLPKVYHLDMVLKHALIGRRKDEGPVVFDHFRLVLNKHGIIRIDRL